MSMYKITWFHAETHFFDIASRKNLSKVSWKKIKKTVCTGCIKKKFTVGKFSLN